MCFPSDCPGKFGNFYIWQHCESVPDGWFITAHMIWQRSLSPPLDPRLNELGIPVTHDLQHYQISILIHYLFSSASRTDRCGAKPYSTNDWQCNVCILNEDDKGSSPSSTKLRWSVRSRSDCSGTSGTLPVFSALFCKIILTWVIIIYHFKQHIQTELFI